MRVLYVQYTNPGAYPPIVRSGQILAEAGAQVLMLGTRVHGLDALSAETVAGMRVELLRAAPEGWRLKAHYARYAAWVAREGATWRPDWIYASDVLSAPVALMLRTLTGASVVYHEHDAPATDGAGWVMRRCLAARQSLTRQAAIVIAPNEARADRLSRVVAGGRPVLTVWNCPRRPAPRRVESAGTSSSLRVVFRGSINVERLPPTVIQAIAASGAPIDLDIAGYETAGSRGYMGELLALAGTLGLADRVRFAGAVHPTELDDRTGRSDIGLALMPVTCTDENLRHMVGASNKVFEYLRVGAVPLVSDLSDWRAAFVNPGYALACRPNDAPSLQRAFEWAAGHRTELRRMADRGIARLLDDWNYERQFAPVMRAMQSSSVATGTTLGGQGIRCAS